MTEQNMNREPQNSNAQEPQAPMALSAAVKKIAWGYIFLHLNINLGTLNILPNWICYLNINQSLDSIGEEVPSIKLLRPLGIVLGIWEGIQWVRTALGMGEATGSAVYFYTALGLLATVVSLYFHFQLLTDLSVLAEQQGCPQKGRLLTLRTVRTVLMTLFALPLPWLEYEVFVFLVLAVQLIITIWICSVLFSLKNSLLEIENGPAEEAAESESRPGTTYWPEGGTVHWPEESPCKEEEDSVE
ncbi:MAG: hypothetical protein E7223_02225 [Clostridiales bacterium]|nr:hypothetical protein [Clostridiales bacterium]